MKFFRVQYRDTGQHFKRVNSDLAIPLLGILPVGILTYVH